MERRKWLTWAVGKEVADKIYDTIEERAKESASTSSDQQCYFISGSFSWSTTKEGYSYWAGVNDEIKKYFARKISPQLTAFLTEKNVWTKFLNNFDPTDELDSYDLAYSFIWYYTQEGYDFWSKVARDYDVYASDKNLSLIKKSKNDENQLQGEEDPRGERGESGRSGVCCEGDESRFRLSYTQHRKRIDFQKGKVGDFKVHISSRHPVLL